MNLLVIGGTRFMGRRLVESALDRGHKVTVFHRGNAGADLFEGRVERILGDRDGDLSKLAGRKWDAVVDMPGYYPRVVRKTCELLKSAERYLFISSISVYDPEPGLHSVNEDSPLLGLEDETVEEITPETYGGLKVLCERVVTDIFGARSIVIRPGYMVGSHDPSDRFTYYPWRLMKGGRMIAGGRRDAPMQVIDARDIAEFCVDSLEKKRSGTFNVCGPETPYRWDNFLERCKAALGVDTELVWFDGTKLEEAGCEPGIDLPLYQGMDESSDAMMRTDNARAMTAGLKFRSLEDTARDAAEWQKARGDEPLKVGMTLEKENELQRKLEASR